MKKISRTFLKLFLSYTAVLLLPLICMSGIQMVMSENMREQNAYAWQNSLDHTAAMEDSVAYSIRSLAESVIQDDSAQAFINTSLIRKKDVSDLYVWKDMFFRYRSTNPNLSSIHLYSASSNWLLGNWASAGDMGYAVRLDPTMFDATLSFTGMTYPQWQEFASGGQNSGFYLMPSGELCYRLSILTAVNRRSMLLLHVERSRMAELLQPLLPDGSSAVVLDATGQPLLLAGMSAFKDDGMPVDEWARLYLSGSLSAPDGYAAFDSQTGQGWTVVSVIPDSELNADVHQLSNLLLRITLAMLLTDVALCLLLTKNNARPLRRIVASISDSMPKEVLDNPDEYILIENTMAMLLEKNTDYRKLSSEQQELISFELVRCLLLGEYWNLDRVEQLVNHSSLPLDNRRFGVISLHPLDGDISRGDIDFIRRALEPMEARSLAFQDRCAVLFFLPVDFTAERWTDYAHSLCLKLNSGGPAYRLCISGLCDSSDQIHIAYDETVALSGIMGADADNSAMEMYYSGAAAMPTETYYDYPIDMELQIIHALKMGNTAMIGELLREVQLHNCVGRKLSAFMTRQLLFEVRGTIIRGMQSFLTDERIAGHLCALCTENTLDGLFQRIEDLAAEMAGVLHDGADRRGDHLEETIYAYLSENYANANLSLEDLVEPLGMSERMLYDFIRERFNSTFAKLLEGLRITKACALLRDGEATIRNVASQVGYNSDHTFRLAFKRVMDVTPSEYASAHARARQSEEARS